MRWIVVILLLLGLLGPVCAQQEEWWNDDWKHRLTITITEKSMKTLIDYQVLVELNSTNFDFEKARPDGADIRFINSGEELSYWIEEWDSTRKKANIWVKVPEIPTNGERIIYMYYGNLDARDESEGDETFEFFDDFEETSLDTSKWKEYGPGSASIVQGQLRLHQTPTKWTHKEVQSLASFPPFEYIFEVDIDAIQGSYVGVIHRDTQIDSHRDTRMGLRVSVVEYYNRHDLCFVHCYSSDQAISGNLWDPLTLKTIYLGDHALVYINNVLTFDYTEPHTHQNLRFGLYTAYCGVGDFDNTRVRKYASPEPVVTIGEKDLFLNSKDISFSDTSPEKGQIITITADIHHTGELNTSNVIVHFYNGNPEVHGKLIGENRISIEANSSKKAEISWNVTRSAEIYVFVDPEDEIAESDEDNNIAFKRLNVEGPDYPMYFIIGLVITLLIIGVIILFAVYKALTYKKPSRENIECPRCGMVLPSGTKECPVCGGEVK